jgi:chemotaxis protein methyltransferase CheR
MQELDCRNVDDYLGCLRQNPAEREKTRELLTVTISRFFRDKQLWEVIRSRLIPKPAHASGPIMRVWSAGCACGEEAYSFKILWNEAEKNYPSLPTLEVWATDINPAALQKAREGVYPPSSLKEVSPQLKNEYFTQVKGGFSIAKELRPGIHWVRHDMLSGAPLPASFDLIFLRNNLLTYYELPLKAPAFLRVVDALRWGGYLIIGNNEEIPSKEVPLKRCSEQRSIFVKSPKILYLPSL